MRLARSNQQNTGRAQVGDYTPEITPYLCLFQSNPRRKTPDKYPDTTGWRLSCSQDSQLVGSEQFPISHLHIFQCGIRIGSRAAVLNEAIDLVFLLEPAPSTNTRPCQDFESLCWRSRQTYIFSETNLLGHVTCLAGLRYLELFANTGKRFLKTHTLFCLLPQSFPPFVQA